MISEPLAFWSVSASDLLDRVQTSPQGLTGDEAQKRLARYGYNLLRPKKRTDTPALLLAQFKAPLVLILVFAAVLSYFLGDQTNAIIILGIVFISSLLGFWQERGATNAVKRLLAIVQIKAVVIRDGNPKEIPAEEIVPGDITVLSAGASVPGDCLILKSKDLFVDEATLTGETYPVEKTVGVLKPETPLSQRTNALFMGTHVVSGTAEAIVARTGASTEFGKVSERLRLRPPETEFERGVRRFGYLLMEVTLILVFSIFAINVYLNRPVLDSFLFALALAIGLTPTLLPAIISINLAHGAKGMSLKHVIVKRLASIENFGSMNVLCSDKTGTLTEGVMRLRASLDIEGNRSEKVLLYAYLNAFYETGFGNPIDEAIRTYRKFNISGYSKLDEVPYDFFRKRLSILVSKGDAHLMVTKGYIQSILDICSSAETSKGKVVDIATVREQIMRRFNGLAEKGFRALGVAYKNIGSGSQISKEDEVSMTFLGLIVFLDPLKHSASRALKNLKGLGIALKIITGDNHLVAAYAAERVGLRNPRILTGSQLRQMSDEALLKRVNDLDVFAEIEPNQKERIILALRKAGNVVGFIGDGINDASALHAADVGISVESAVDVAKEAADIVLLKRDLNVLADGVREGRITFANTLKYVFMATSANFGNMFSMAGASLFLDFLPLLPKQILLNNLMTDFPEMTIATDCVDKELIEKPRRWDIKFITRFMLVFGPLSSIFDFLTFGVLLFLLSATQDQFRAGWFMESVVSATVIVLVVRTRKPFVKSRPGKYLLVTTLLIASVSVIIPFVGLGQLFQFQPLQTSFILMMALIVVLYVVAAEIAKRLFYRKMKTQGSIP
jgi:Mg2+-importing ATPase